MIEHKTQIRVRYGETDQMGFVYHGNYPQYFEIGRIEFLRELGVSYKEMEEKNIILPVVNMQLNFKKPAKYDENIELTTIIEQIPTSKFMFSYMIKNERGDILTTGETTLVFVNAITKKPIKCPPYVIEKIKSALNPTL